MKCRSACTRVHYIDGHHDEIKQHKIFSRSPCSNLVVIIIAPNAHHSPPSMARAGARANWSRSGHHLAMLSRQSRRSRRVKALAIPAPGSQGIFILQQQHHPRNKTKLHLFVFLLCSSIRVDKFFEVEMTVRDNDLDQYGVVNNAIYVAYIHNAREELAASIGFSMASVAHTGNAMALLELNLKYFKPLLVCAWHIRNLFFLRVSHPKPLRLSSQYLKRKTLSQCAKFVVKVRVVQIKGVRILVEHFIETLPDRALVLEAIATVVCLNKDYRPTRVFPEMSSKLQQFFSTQDG
ncbi:hypothetical protein VPH35_049034 [Triticum aestivum]